MLLKWNTSREDARLIREIVDRAIVMGVIRLEKGATKRDAIMDVTAVHANGTPLRLRALLDAPAFDFAHDLAGISRHLDRSSGQLGGCFVPRFAVPVSERERAHAATE